MGWFPLVVYHVVATPSCDYVSPAPIGFMSLVPSFAYCFMAAYSWWNEFGGHGLIPICRPFLCMDMGYCPFVVLVCVWTWVIAHLLSLFVYGHGLMPICRPFLFCVRTWVDAHLLSVFRWTWDGSQLLSFAVCGHGLIPICRPPFFFLFFWWTWVDAQLLFAIRSIR